LSKSIWYMGKINLEREIDESLNESKRLNLTLKNNKVLLIDEIKNGLGDSIRTIGNKVDVIKKPKLTLLHKLNNLIRNFFTKF